MTPITQDTENNKVIVRELRQELKALIERATVVRDLINQINAIEYTKDMSINKTLRQQLRHASYSLIKSTDYIGQAIAELSHI